MAFANRNRGYYPTGLDAIWARAWTADAVSDLASISAIGGAAGPKHGDIAFVTANSQYYLWMDDGTWRVIPMSSYGQLPFPATQNPSSNANTLDDYEEGTFTPFLGGNTSESGQVYSVQSGVYIKIGRVVTCWFAMTLSTLGTITGGLRVKGFPFTSDNGVAGLFGSVPAFWSSWNTNQNVVQINMIVNSTEAFIISTTAAATGIGTQPTSADLTNVSITRGCLSYLAAA